MKKISILFLLFVGLSFVSCDVEPIDSAVLNQNDTTDNGISDGGTDNTGGVDNTGGGDNTGGSSSSGDYWPSTVGNWWQFEQNNELLDPMEMIGTDTFNNLTYYQFGTQSGSGSTVFGTAKPWLNKNNGAYTIKMDDIDISAGGLTGTQTGYEFIVLKDNINVNATWNGTYSQTTTYTGIPPISQDVNYTGTILEKNATVTVDGETYSNVIKVKIEQVITLPGTPATTVVTEYWFAKDIGPVRAYTSMPGSTPTESILTSYAVN